MYNHIHNEYFSKPTGVQHPMITYHISLHFTQRYAHYSPVNGACFEATLIARVQICELAAMAKHSSGLEKDPHNTNKQLQRFRAQSQ